MLEFIAYSILKYIFSWIYNIIAPSSILTFDIDLVTMARIIYRFIYFVGLSSGYWFALNIITQRKEISDLEKAKLLDQLQQQQLEKKNWSILKLPI
ncbi:hypothetical protein [Pedobacter sp. NJ-S-72]